MTSPLLPLLPPDVEAIRIEPLLESLLEPLRISIEPPGPSVALPPTFTSPPVVFPDPPSRMTSPPTEKTLLKIRRHL